MGIRFNKIRTTAMENYDSYNDYFMDYTQDKQAVFVGGSSNEGTVYRFGGENISKNKLSSEFGFSLHEMRKYGSNVIFYIASEGNLVKFTIDSEQQRQSLPSPSNIKSIVVHPSENSLVVFNEDEVYLAESNTNILTLTQNITINGAKMLYETIDSGNKLFVATIEEQDQKVYLRVRKLEQITYPSAYSNSTLNEEVVGVLENGHSFSFQSGRYFKKPKLLAFTVYEYAYDQAIYYSMFFNINLEKIKTEYQLEKANRFVFSESEDRIVIQEDNRKICSYDYSLSATSLSLKNQNCLNEISPSEKSLLHQVLHIEGKDYPMVKQQSNVLRAYSWDLNEVKIQYTEQSNSDPLVKPDGLLQLKYYSELAEYDIVPISVGGILGLTFGSFCLCIIITIILVNCCCKKK